MSKKMIHRVIFMIALISFASFAGPATASPAGDELFAAPISTETPEDIFDSFVSHVWQFINPALSKAPSAISIWNH